MALSHIRFDGPTSVTHSDIDVAVIDEPIKASAAGVELLLDDAETSKWIQPFGSYLLNCNAVRNMASFWLSKIDPTSNAQSLSQDFDLTCVKDRQPS